MNTVAARVVGLVDDERGVRPAGPDRQRPAEPGLGAAHPDVYRPVGLLGTEAADVVPDDP